MVNENSIFLPYLEFLIGRLRYCFGVGVESLSPVRRHPTLLVTVHYHDLKRNPEAGCREGKSSFCPTQELTFYAADG
jgi:hypothetical protein